jgi:hypothetical protein
MHKFVISDPSDRANPFEEFSSANPLIYHGTHSTFCQSIEEKGFRFDSFIATYGQYLRVIVDACNKLYIGPDGLACATGFVNKGYIYFSRFFRLARIYARNAGCERIDGALRAARGFLGFVQDEQRVQLQAIHWEQVLRQHGRPHPPTEQVLANLRNSDLISKLTEQVVAAQSALLVATKQGYPVVYAVLADRKWIDGVGSPTLAGLQEPFGGIRLTAVSPDQIVGRADFTNGIAPESE